MEYHEIVTSHIIFQLYKFMCIWINICMRSFYRNGSILFVVKFISNITMMYIIKMSVDLIKISFSLGLDCSYDTRYRATPELKYLLRCLPFLEANNFVLSSFSFAITINWTWQNGVEFRIHCNGISPSLMNNYDITHFNFR